MSMIAELHSLTDENLDKIVETPTLIGHIVNPDNPYIFDESVPEQEAPEMILKLGGNNQFSIAKSKPPLPRDYPDLELSKPETKIDLDKAWHGIHYCQTGDAGVGDHPLGFILYGGVEVCEINVGHGPARIFSSGQTRVIEKMLSAVSVEDLKANYVPAKMEDIYPDIWSRTDEDNFEYIEIYFEVLGRFLKSCAENKMGFATYIV